MAIGSILASLAAPVIGATVGNWFSRKQDAKNRQQQDKVNQQNIQQQNDMAQNQLQWRVEDAKKAGLHPLAGIGATPYQAIPTSQAYENTAGRDLGNNLAQAFNKLDFGSQRELQKLEVERAKLENELMRSNIRNTKVTGINPSPAMTKQINSDNELVKINQSEISAHNPATPGVSAGINPSFDLYAVDKNKYKLLPNSKLAEATENNFIQQMLTNIDGMWLVKPKFADELFKGKYDPKTQMVDFDFTNQTFSIVNKNKNQISYKDSRLKRQLLK